MKRILSLLIGLVWGISVYAVVQNGASPKVIHNTLQRYAKPGGVIIPYKKSKLNSFVNASGFVSAFNSNDTEKLLNTKENGEELIIVRSKLKMDGNVEGLVNTLSQDAAIAWAAPNYVYVGDPRDVVKDARPDPTPRTNPLKNPNDPQLTEQYHHPLMQNTKAWELTGGSTDIIVAATDDGFDLSHEDLAGQFWTNKKEIPGNGIDDDGNGYIDDVNGWDFATGNNDPTPNASGNDHGTHVAGIVAAAASNSKGVAGTAPGIKVMPVQFYNYGTWTSDMIAKAYAYAADNGARIITTSYNVDGFVSDKVVQSGIQYAYDKGLLHFNSAGNNSQYNPPRAKFTQMLLVCSTIADNKANDHLSDFSNYGPGVDVCAPGGGGDAGILSTIPHNAYERMSGTSMATPNAAASAALIWSYHPTWNRDQVAAQLLATADSLNALNPTRMNMMGSGRVNSLRALTEKAHAPKILKVEYGTITLDPTQPLVAPNQVVVHFRNIFDPTTLNDKKNWDLRSAGKDGIYDTADDVVYAFDFDTEYRIGTNELLLKPTKLLTKGRVRVKLLASGAKDPFGTKLDGNGDGVPGDDFVAEINVP